MSIVIRLIERLLKYKNDVSSDFKDFCSKFDIIGFCETFVKEKSEFTNFLKAYDVFNCVREKAKKKRLAKWWYNSSYQTFLPG